MRYFVVFPVLVDGGYFWLVGEDTNQGDREVNCWWVRIPTQGNWEVNLLVSGDTNPGELGSELLVGEDTNPWELGSEFAGW